MITDPLGYIEKFRMKIDSDEWKVVWELGNGVLRIGVMLEKSL
jgi:hypothetical protein